MKKEFKEREQTLKNLFENFKFDGASILPVDTVNTIEKVEKKLNIKLDDSLKSLYKFCKRYSISWKATFNDFSVNGYTAIRPLSLFDSLETGNNTVLSFKNIEIDFNPKSLIIFDVIDMLGNYVLIQIEKEKTNLFLFTYHTKLNKLNLTIEEYLEKSILYFGTQLWQQFYIDSPSNISNFYIYDNRYTDFLERLLNQNTLDYQKIQNPLEEIKQKKTIANTAKDYKNLIYNKIEYLKNNKSFKLKNINLENNASVNSIMKIQEILNHRLPSEIIDFYLQINGMQIEWTIGKEYYGQINILQLEQIFGGKEWYYNEIWDYTQNYNDIFCTGEEDDEYVAIASKLRPIEIFNGSSGFVGFIINENQDFDLYYSGSRGEIMKLPISFEKYLQLNIRLLGIDGWLEYYRDGKDASIGGNNLLDEITIVYPDFKIEEFS